MTNPITKALIKINKLSSRNLIKVERIWMLIKEAYMDNKVLSRVFHFTFPSMKNAQKINIRIDIIAVKEVENGPIKSEV